MRLERAAASRARPTSPAPTGALAIREFAGRQTGLLGLGAVIAGADPCLTDIHQRVPVGAAFDNLGHIASGRFIGRVTVLVASGGEADAQCHGEGDGEAANGLHESMVPGGGGRLGGQVAIGPDTPCARVVGCTRGPGTALQPAMDDAKQTPRAVSLRPRDNLRFDLPAGLVVFLIALPLCLGIAHASHAPLLSGLIAGIVGGLIVAPLSGSALSVSGPAAGLLVVVMASIDEFGFGTFLLAVVLSGVLQLLLGLMRAGVIAYYLPHTVIKGMLAGIGAVLVLKQLPHAVGFEADFEGDMAFLQSDGHNTLTEIPYALGHIHLGALAVSAVGLAVLILWSRIGVLKRLRFVPAPLVVVGGSIALNGAFMALAPSLGIHNPPEVADGPMLVSIPALSSLSDFAAATTFPDFSRIADTNVWRTAGVLAAIASVETLLCIEAVDKLDPFKRTSPASRELLAQGCGNIVSGLIGGLPVTSVIVRSSANVQSGGRTWVSAFIHGLLLVAAIFVISPLLNLVPLAALAAILLHVGYKLAPLSLFKKVWSEGLDQFLPFIVTFSGILFVDLLSGVLIGLFVGVVFVLRVHLRNPFWVDQTSTIDGDGHDRFLVKFGDNISFLNKANVNRMLQEFPNGSVVELDLRATKHVDHDVAEILGDFAESAAYRGVRVEILGDYESLQRPMRHAADRADAAKPKAKEVARAEGLAVTTR